MVDADLAVRGRARGGHVLFTSNEGLHRVSPDKKQSDWVLNQEAGFNGCKILSDGTLLRCASRKSAIWRVNAIGERTGEAAIECEGRPLRSPNDITLDYAGGFYFTDRGDSCRAPIGTVHYTPTKGLTTLAAGGLNLPNGVVISTGCKFLFASETIPNRVLRFPLNGPGKLGPLSVLVHLPPKEGHETGPDGIAIGPVALF